MEKNHLITTILVGVAFIFIFYNIDQGLKNSFYYLFQLSFIDKNIIIIIKQSQEICIRNYPKRLVLSCIFKEIGCATMWHMVDIVEFG